MSRYNLPPGALETLVPSDAVFTFYKGTDGPRSILPANLAAALRTADTMKQYVAVVAQAGTAIPASAILENTLGAVPVWTRSSAGVYVLTLIDAFPAGRTVLFVTPNAGAGKTAVAAITTDAITFTIASGGTPTDALIDNMSLQILIYPA